MSVATVTEQTVSLVQAIAKYLPQVAALVPTHKLNFISVYEDAVVARFSRYDAEDHYFYIAPGREPVEV